MTPDGSLPVAKQPHVLIIDDDPAMQRMLSHHLGDHNMRTSIASDREGLAKAYDAQTPDLIVLDVQLGTDDGFELLRDLRKRSVVPVIIVTGHRRAEIDQVIGLELGADDYITKPFGLNEFLARVRAALRRRRMDSVDPAREKGATYHFAGWTFDQVLRQLSRAPDEVVSLTKAEFALLSAFVAAPRRPLTREHLLHATRVHEDVFDRSIDVQILRLRRKLEDDPRDPRLIRTERGVGYLFDADVVRS